MMEESSQMTSTGLRPCPEVPVSLPHCTAPCTQLESTVCFERETQGGQSAPVGVQPFLSPVPWAFCARPFQTHSQLVYVAGGAVRASRQVPPGAPGLEGEALRDSPYPKQRTPGWQWGKHHIIALKGLSRESTDHLDVFHPVSW